MNQHTAVRFKGSRWEAVAHRAGAGRGSDHAWPGSDAAEDDILLDLAIRHFADIDLTAGELHDFAVALRQVAAGGDTVSIFPVSSTQHAYEISRHVAAVTVRFGQCRLHLPVDVALQLADELDAQRARSTTYSVAA
ncbi:MAG: hypothetical protein QNJ91_09840 [Gammaproteobacteria bacterium]|nr:hypothetical protein [Gammaproteobacteria bacterium]